MHHRLFAAGLFLLIAALSALVQPPRSPEQLVFAQLRLPVHGAAQPTGNGLLFWARTVHKVSPPVHQQKTSTLFTGERRIVSSGKPGTVAVEHPIHVASDGLARSLSVQRVPLTPPQPTTILVGTAKPHYLMRGGVLYRYSRRLTLVATAYNASYAQNGPWGATARLNGAPLTKGMVAVDPNVIPLGTRLYVESYGPALAADTGSAIIGDRIDLFFNLDTQQTANFGIKKLNVYVLGPPGA
ncbi:MAG: 3D domain-containing protein [Thermaerobacter sp.]|nr:3D domain-containing protein [Thermaerobacter sp.]